MAAGRFERLKPKHHSVLNAIEQQHARSLELRIGWDQLLTRAVTPTVAAKNRIWDQIQSVDRDHDDRAAEIVIAPLLRRPCPALGPSFRSTSRWRTAPGSG